MLFGPPLSINICCGKQLISISSIKQMLRCHLTHTWRWRLLLLLLQIQTLLSSNRVHGLCVSSTALSWKKKDPVLQKGFEIEVLPENAWGGVVGWPAFRLLELLVIEQDLYDPSEDCYIGRHKKQISGIEVTLPCDLVRYFCFGTHQRTPVERMYAGGNPFIDFMSMGWRRQTDLHGDEERKHQRNAQYVQEEFGKHMPWKQKPLENIMKYSPRRFDFFKCIRR